MLTGGEEDLKRFVGALDKVPEALRDSLDKSAKEITDSARAGYRAGVSPDGRRWKPRKDGEIAVQRPAAEVEFVAEGSAIVGKAPAVLDYHSQTRPVFPEGIPSTWKNVLENNARDAFEENFK